MMKKQKTRLSMLMCMLFALALMTAAAYGQEADSNGDGYHDGDVAAVLEIIKAGSDLSEAFPTENPEDWTKEGLVAWNNSTPKRVTGLDLIGYDEYAKSPDISALAALTKLEIDCASPEVTTLDTGSNLALEVLDCTGTNIKNLDVSKNAKLKKLFFSETPVANIDVSNNPELTALDCSQTFVSQLELSKNAALESLTCYDTGISELDLSGNPVLNNLNCHRTKLSALDVTVLPELKILYCWGTGIAVLDLSKNAKLTDLDCGSTAVAALDLSNNPELIELSCSGTFLTSLDLSANTKLEQVFLNDFITDFTAPNGHRLTVGQRIGGTAAANYYDVKTNEITVRAEPKNGYWVAKWTGLPANAKMDGNEVVFKLTRDITIYAKFTKTPVAVNDLEVKSTSTKYLKLAWTELEGADGYKVYQYDSGKKKYRKLKKLTGEGATAYTVRKLSPGKGYKFKVCAFANGKNGKFAVLKAPTKPLKTTVSKLATGSAKHYIKATWKEKTGTGYQVKIATDSKFTKNKKAYQVTSQKKISKKMNSLKEGRTYYVKVRAYKKYGGRTAYGSWSRVKKIKCR